MSLFKRIFNLDNKHPTNTINMNKAYSTKELKKLDRKELDEIAKSYGVNPADFKKQKDLADMVYDKQLPFMVNNNFLSSYKSNKVVTGAKIETVKRKPNGSADIKFINKELGVLNVDSHYVRKQSPRGGGYFIIYEDGTRSYQSAEMFERGYDSVE